MFVITWIVIGCNSYSGPSLPQHSYMEMESKNYNQAQTISYLQKEIDRLRRELDQTCPRICYRNNRTCFHCEPKVVYAESPDKQKVIDLIQKSAKPFDELKKEFGIK